MCTCTFQPRNFTGCGSEGVKGIKDELLALSSSLTADFERGVDKGNLGGGGGQSEGRSWSHASTRT